MKAPICGICLNSDILCMACKKKIDEGSITESDVRISRIVYSLAKTYRSLRDITIRKVIENGSIAVIICDKGDRPKIIGSNGAIINKLSKIIGKNTRVVEETSNIKDFIQNLIHPVQIVGVNIIYASEGEILKVILPKGKKIPIPKASFDMVISLVFGKKATMIYNL